MTGTNAAGPVTTSPCAGVAAGTFLSGPGPVVDFGPGAVARIPGHLAGLGVRRVLVVTDAGLRAAGVVDAVVAPVGAAGLAVEVDDAVTGNPSVALVEEGAERARALGVDVVLALGGGSSLDAAKGIALLAPTPGARADGTGAAPGAGLPVVAVPTTAGTGAETNGFGVLEDPASRQKVYCGDVSVVPRVAVLDPELTHGLPARPTAATGVDALVSASSRWRRGAATRCPRPSPPRPCGARGRGSRPPSRTVPTPAPAPRCSSPRTWPGRPSRAAVSAWCTGSRTP